MSFGGLTHHIARVNGIRIHYVEAGAGDDTVVLLHGFAQTSREWYRNVIPALAKHYRVIAPDLRGAGDSDKPPSGYDKKTMADDIYKLVHDHLSLERILLVGHDFGAHTAYAYTGAHPESVRRLVILDTILAGFGYEQAMQHPFATDGLGRAVWHIGFIDSPYGIPEALIRGRERMFLSWFHRNFAYDPTAIPDEDLDEYERAYSSPGGLNALQYYTTHYEDAAHFKELAKRKLAMPVLALGGEAFLGEGVKRWMEELASDVRGGAVKHCGHWIADERPEELVQALLEFFAEERSSSSKATAAISR
jgi:pimeloyl-ACP methyl ester carboxylesterase